MSEQARKNRTNEKKKRNTKKKKTNLSKTQKKTNIKPRKKKCKRKKKRKNKAINKYHFHKHSNVEYYLIVVDLVHEYQYLIYVCLVVLLSFVSFYLMVF